MHNPIKVTTLTDILTIVSLIVGLFSIAISIVFFFYASSSKKIEAAATDTQNSLKQLELLSNSFNKEAFALVKEITGEMTKYFISQKIVTNYNTTNNRRHNQRPNRPQNRTFRIPMEAYIQITD